MFLINQHCISQTVKYAQSNLCTSANHPLKIMVNNQIFKKHTSIPYAANSPANLATPICMYYKIKSKRRRIQNTNIAAQK